MAEERVTLYRNRETGRITNELMPGTNPMQWEVCTFIKESALRERLAGELEKRAEKAEYVPGIAATPFANGLREAAYLIRQSMRPTEVGKPAKDPTKPADLLDPPPDRCPDCGSDDPATFGYGSSFRRPGHVYGFVGPGHALGRCTDPWHDPHPFEEERDD